MAELDLVIADCTVVTSDSVFDGWVGVREDRIAAMGRGQPPDAARIVDGRGLHLLPGRVEPHCHLRASNFGDEVEESSRQAAAGGVTTLMPYMRAAASYLDLVPEWSRQVSERSICDVAFHLQIQIPAHIDEIAECHERFGIRSYKVHIDARRNPQFGLLPVDDGDAYLTMLAAREFGGIVAIHCENSEITRYLEEQARAAGRHGLETWADVRPPLAEASDVNNVVFLAAKLGCRILIVHVSAADSLAAARLHGHNDVIVEALIHQLAVTAVDTEARIGAAGKMNPPVRGQSEIEALWSAVLGGEIQFVGTDDHIADWARLSNERSGPVDFWEAESATPGIGIGTPLFLTEGLRREVDIRLLVRLMSEAPARAFGLAQKGSIAVGKDADLVLVDLEAERVVTTEAPVSVGLTVGDGLRLRGWPVMTILRGRVVFEGGEVIPASGVGRVVSGDRVTATAAALFSA